MLEGLFVGPLAIVHDAPTALEQPWTLKELRLAIQRPKLKQSPDETRLTAELLKAAPEKFLDQTLAALNIFLESGRIRGTWKLTTFRVLPKKLRAIQTYCKQQAFLQGIWVSDPWPCGGNFGGETTGGTTWLSTRPKIGRTFVDSEPSTG